MQKRTNRVISVLMAIVMAVSLLSGSALAADVSEMEESLIQETAKGPEVEQQETEEEAADQALEGDTQTEEEDSQLEAQEEEQFEEREEEERDQPQEAEAEESDEAAQEQVEPLSAATDTYTISAAAGSDITAELKRAVTSASTVVISAGNYKCSGVRLNDVNGLTIQADGATITQSGSEPILYTSGSATALTIWGGTWDGAKVGNATLRFYGSVNGLTLQNLTVQASGAEGIGITGAKNVTMSQVKSIKNGTDALFVRQSDVTIDSCEFSDNGRYGIQASGCTNITANNLVANRNGEYGAHFTNGPVTLNNASVLDNQYIGVSFAGKATKAVVNGGEFMGNGAYAPDNKGDAERANGIGVYTGAQLDIIKARCDGNTGSGISVGGEKNAVSGANVVGCSLQNNIDHGMEAHGWGWFNISAAPDGTKTQVSGALTAALILIDNCYSDYIKDCVVKNNKNLGLSVAENSVAKLVSNCEFSNNGDNGLHVRNKSRVTVKNCTCAGNKGVGMAIYSASKVTAQKCVFKNNKRDGVRVNDKNSTLSITDCQMLNNQDKGLAAGKYAKVTKMNNCKISGTKSYGVYCASGSSVVMSKCTVQKGKGDGVRVTDKKSALTMTQSKVNNNNAHGLIVTNQGKVNKLQKCTISGNVGYGVLVQKKSALNSASGNSVKGNKKGQVKVDNTSKSALKADAAKKKAKK